MFCTLYAPKLIYCHCLGHKRLRKFVQNLVWWTTLGIVITNMKRVLVGYETKIECIWGSTGLILEESVHRLFNETEQSVHNFYTKLLDADFASALSNALSPTLEVGKIASFSCSESNLVTQDSKFTTQFPTSRHGLMIFHSILEIHLSRPFKMPTRSLTCLLSCKKSATQR